MVINEIQAERNAQLSKWGHASDDQWLPAEWSALLAHYATRSAVGDLRTVDILKFRADLVKLGALSVAAIEAIDRKGLTP